MDKAWNADLRANFDAPSTEAITCDINLREAFEIDGEPVMLVLAYTVYKTTNKRYAGMPAIDAALMFSADHRILISVQNIADFNTRIAGTYTNVAAAVILPSLPVKRSA